MRHRLGGTARDREHPRLGALREVVHELLARILGEQSPQRIVIFVQPRLTVTTLMARGQMPHDQLQ